MRSLPYRWVGFIVFLACISGAFGSGGGKITFEAHAERLDKLLTDLSRTSGTYLSAGPDLAGEIVAVSVHDVSIADLKSKLAEATDGFWKSEGKTTYLVRSEALLNAHRKRTHEQRKGSLIHGLQDAWPVSAKKLGATRWKAYREKDGFPPEYLDLTLLIGLDSLAQLRRGQTVGYSTKPAGGERRLSTEANELLIRGWSKDAAYDIGPIALTKLQVGCIDQGLRAMYLIKLEACDVSGRTLHETLVNFFADEYREDARFYGGASLGIPLSRPDANNGLKLSPPSQDFAEAYNAVTEGDSEQKPVRIGGHEQAALNRIQERMRHPDAVDPLWYASDLLISAEGSLKRQLVCDLPDRFTADSVWELCHPSSAEIVDALIQGTTSIITTRASNWTVVQPRDPDFAAERRIDRHALADFANLARERTPISLERAVYLARAGFILTDSNWVVDSPQTIKDPAAIWMDLSPFPSPLSCNGDDRVLRWLATLSAEELNELQKTGRLGKNRLSKSQLQGLLRFETYNENHPKPYRPEEIEGVSLHDAKEAAFIEVDDEFYFQWLYSPMLSLTEVSERLESDEARNRNKSFRVGTTNWFYLSIFVAGENPIVETLDLPWFDSNQAPVQYQKLAPDLLKKIDSERARIRIARAKPKQKTVPPGIPH